MIAAETTLCSENSKSNNNWYKPVDGRPGKVTLATMTQTGGSITQDVLDCLDDYLKNNDRGARIDTATLSILPTVVAQFERGARAEVGRLLRIVPEPKRRPAYVFFCEQAGYGAFSFRNIYDYIVLHVDDVSTVMDFCLRMMERPELWPSIGGKISEGEDHSRLAFAVMFSKECFDFIVRHELAHLVLGHCDFSCPDSISAQALEVVADGHAAIWGFQRLSRIRNRFGLVNGPIDGAYRSYLQTDVEAMYHYLLVLYFVFRLCRETKWTSDTLTTHPHPPAPIRFHVVCLHLQEYFQQRNDIEGQRLLTAAMQEIWEKGEFIFARTFDSVPDTNAKRQVLEAESEQHFALVHERAKTLPQHLFGL
ncbi:MAG: hypothetical protein ACLPX9_03085 [Rhodomicrobium sp.]